MEGLTFNNAIEIGEAPPLKEDGSLDISNLGFSADDLDEPTPTTPAVEDVPTTPDVEIVPETTETTPVETTDFLEYIPGVANFLAEKGIIKEVPTGIDLEAFGEEEFIATINHNMETAKYDAWNKGVKDEQERLVGKLSPLSQKMLSYNLNNPNAEDSEMAAYLQSISDNDFVQELNVETHADKIVSDYYEKVAKWTKSEVADKLSSLTASESLKKEAEILKPKLANYTAGLVKQKTEQAELIAEQTRQINQQLGGKVNDLLRTGKLNNIPITREEAGFIQTALLNDEVPVMIKGKKVEMGYAEALVLQQKYQGSAESLQNLALGLLIIKNGPKAIEKFIGKQARTKETESFIRQNKFSNTKKKSVSVDGNKMYDSGSGGLNFSL